MLEIKKSIKSLYEINLIEGEGLGTSYEYYVKLRKLKNFINSIGNIERILMAGLPEKYGLSMDFFFLAHLLRAETVVIDERNEALEKAWKALNTLKKKNLCNDINFFFSAVDSLAEFDNHCLHEDKFDLAFSSEVLQRLKEDKARYLLNLRKKAKNSAIFAPNGKNSFHVKLSGLKGVYLEELLDLCNQTGSGSNIFDSGYLDLPPFPPGLSRSQESRERASESRVDAFFMKGLEIYSKIEKFMPKVVKEKNAHIVYVMIKNQ